MSRNRGNRGRYRSVEQVVCLTAAQVDFLRNLALQELSDGQGWAHHMAKSVDARLEAAEALTPEVAVLLKAEGSVIRKVRYAGLRKQAS